ncbi:LacI family DNA-binding transcriptional regulator [Streptomyces heliomycini]
MARLAGVSRATVSYVLNNAGAVRISEPTRRRVREAAKELGYVPHAAARSLRAGHSRTVLMPAPAFPVGPLYSRFINDLQASLARLDYTVVQYGTVRSARRRGRPRLGRAEAVAVLVPGSGLGPRGVEVLKRSGGAGRRHPRPRSRRGRACPAPGPRRRRAQRRRPPLRPGPPPDRVVVPRGAGLEAFSAPRLAGRCAPPCAAPAPRSPSCRSRSTRPTPPGWPTAGASSAWNAVFTYNDEYAMLLMRALQDEGVRIPEETAVVGADDLMLGRLLRPRLSTVHLELPAAASWPNWSTARCATRPRRPRPTRCWGRR